MGISLELGAVKGFESQFSNQHLIENQYELGLPVFQDSVWTFCTFSEQITFAKTALQSSYYIRR